MQSGQNNTTETHHTNHHHINIAKKFGGLLLPVKEKRAILPYSRSQIQQKYSPVTISQNLYITSDKFDAWKPSLCTAYAITPQSSYDTGLDYQLINIDVDQPDLDQQLKAQFPWLQNTYHQKNKDNGHAHFIVALQTKFRTDSPSDLQIVDNMISSPFNESTPSDDVIHVTFRGSLSMKQFMHQTNTTKETLSLRGVNAYMVVGGKGNLYTDLNTLMPSIVQWTDLLELLTFLQEQVGCVNVMSGWGGQKKIHHKADYITEKNHTFRKKGESHAEKERARTLSIETIHNTEVEKQTKNNIDSASTYNDEGNFDSERALPAPYLVALLRTFRRDLNYTYLQKKGYASVQCPSPHHNDKNRSAQMNLNGTVFCHTCDRLWNTKKVAAWQGVSHLLYKYTMQHEDLIRSSRNIPTLFLPVVQQVRRRFSFVPHSRYTNPDDYITINLYTLIGMTNKKVNDLSWEGDKKRPFEPLLILLKLMLKYGENTWVDYKDLRYTHKLQRGVISRVRKAVKSIGTDTDEFYLNGTSRKGFDIKTPSWSTIDSYLRVTKFMPIRIPHAYLNSISLMRLAVFANHLCVLSDDGILCLQQHVIASTCPFYADRSCVALFLKKLGVVSSQVLVKTIISQDKTVRRVMEHRQTHIGRLPNAMYVGFLSSSCSQYTALEPETEKLLAALNAEDLSIRSTTRKDDSNNDDDSSPPHKRTFFYPQIKLRNEDLSYNKSCLGQLMQPIPRSVDHPFGSVDLGRGVVDHIIGSADPLIRSIDHTVGRFRSKRSRSQQLAISPQHVTVKINVDLITKKLVDRATAFFHSRKAFLHGSSSMRNVVKKLIYTAKGLVKHIIFIENHTPLPEPFY